MGRERGIDDAYREKDYLHQLVPQHQPNPCGICTRKIGPEEVQEKRKTDYDKGQSVLGGSRDKPGK